MKREEDGDVNAVEYLENTETSAIGRALANLGFTASAERPSREEMMRAARARQAPRRVAAPRPRTAPAPAPSPLLQSHAAALRGAPAPLALARPGGVRPA